MLVDIERRLISRTPLHHPAKVLVSRDHPFEVETVDVSVGGIGVVALHPILPGTPCAVAFELSMPEGMRRINAWGSVVYDSLFDTQLHRIGITFVDMDAYSRHLLQRVDQHRHATHR
ncbi:PilZ domain-containing protein [Noviherbaspirillum saxi]|uniref:PilZ domain-containing protein n=1 Tax=Noviherbaspirillum saxi TaxID=2320863 RepID=A0A3A3FL50_9BURK|nr:PilZ domain-containing protein [Noviherbaspirillum saxi]RJF96027.1 PilZ domain-containing protein [Noviherbaspirillum saxi]